MSASDYGDNNPKKLETIYLRIAPQRFHFLKFILEGYGNLAVLSSFDMKKGIVRLRTSREQLSDLFELLSAVAKKIGAMPAIK